MYGLKEAADDLMVTSTNCIKSVNLYTTQRNPWAPKGNLVHKTSVGNAPYVMAGSTCQLSPSEEIVRHAAVCNSSIPSPNKNLIQASLALVRSQILSPLLKGWCASLSSTFMLNVLKRL